MSTAPATVDNGMSGSQASSEEANGASSSSDNPLSSSSQSSKVKRQQIQASDNISEYGGDSQDTAQPGSGHPPRHSLRTSNVQPTMDHSREVNRTPTIPESTSSSSLRESRLHQLDPPPRPFAERLTSSLLRPASSLSKPASSSAPNIDENESTNGSLIDNEPWDTVRWTRLKRISNQVFTEAGRRNYGKPTCIAVSALIVLGTARGLILVYDYHQNLKALIGAGTRAVESGPITAVALSADHSTVAGGHADGSVHTWEIARPSKPFLQLPSTHISHLSSQKQDGHTRGVSILHIAFLGTRHTALVTADDRGMAFAHLASRGLGSISRSIRTTRILGRYPEPISSSELTKRPSTILAFSTLPLGNVASSSDTMGFVAMLTPYLLVVVSTTPIAQTQHKASRPKDLTPHGALSAALAWHPPMKSANVGNGEHIKNAKLAYSWLNMVTILEVVEVEASGASGDERPAEFDFKVTQRWEGPESIVAMQWLSYSVLALLTITQQLLILDDGVMRVTDSSDLLRKQTYHSDFFSSHLDRVVGSLDEDNGSMHGVVADAFYMSFRAYKGRLFLLGHYDVSIGTLSNWADRLLALMEHGDFVAAIRLATKYFGHYPGQGSIGLPVDTPIRQSLVGSRLSEMMLASLKYVFGREVGNLRIDESQLTSLADACFEACLLMRDLEFLFEEVYPFFSDSQLEDIFLAILETHVIDGGIDKIPPAVLKDMVNRISANDRGDTLEALLCKLNPETMDIDQVTSLCRESALYGALFYIWAIAISDFVTVLEMLMSSIDKASPEDVASVRRTAASHIFPYLSYTLTGRIYPTGETMPDDKAWQAKSSLYFYIFSSENELKSSSRVPFTHLRQLIDLDAASLLRMFDEAFEDSFLNSNPDTEDSIEAPSLDDRQRFGLSLNRQYVLKILLQVLAEPDYSIHDIIYLDMFIARNIAKYPQFILLPGSVAQRVLVDLCSYPDESMAGDCQLSLEYLLSVYQPPDSTSLVSLLSRAKFFHILKTVYRSEGQYSLLLQTCFEDIAHSQALFDTVREFLSLGSTLDEEETQQFKEVIVANASRLLDAGLAPSATTLEVCAPELHHTMIRELIDDNLAQYHYLRAVLGDPETYRSETCSHGAWGDPTLVERYIELLCEFSPRHVTDYVELLEVGDIRLDSTLPALETNGIVDAAVVLLVRNGALQKGLDRLVRHLETLGAALVGVLSKLDKSPDLRNTCETVSDLLASLEKFTGIGIWLCKIQSHSYSSIDYQLQHGKRDDAQNLRSEGEDGLTDHELLWLEFLDTVIQVTRRPSELLGSGTRLDTLTLKPIEKLSGHPHVPQSSKVLSDRLRSVVQTTFTALLAISSNPKAVEDSGDRVSFLRIFQAYLLRASASSPSLSHIREVLSTIFSAYAYQEKLLSLAQRLLEMDLYVRVDKVSMLRRKGWRPLGQACGGCGAKLWGPGIGNVSWESWMDSMKRQSQSFAQGGEGDIGVPVDRSAPAMDKGKGRALVSSNTLQDASDTFKGRDDSTGLTDIDKTSFVNQGAEALIVFSCRHTFHRRCLDSLENVSQPSKLSGQSQDLGQQRRYFCPLELES